MKILEQYADRINGTFSFFDRIIIKGYINRFFTSSGAGSYASQCGVLLKDFSAFAQGVTENLKDSIKTYTESNGRELIYVRSPKESKEDIAIKALQDKPIEEGLICTISAVEECFSLEPKKIVLGILNSREPSESVFIIISIFLIRNSVSCMCVFSHGSHSRFRFISMAER